MSEEAKAAVFKHKSWKTWSFSILGLVSITALAGGVPQIGIQPILGVNGFIVCFFGLLVLHGGKEMIDAIKIIKAVNGGKPDAPK